MNKQLRSVLAAAAVLAVAVSPGCGHTHGGVGVRSYGASPGPALVSADGRVITVTDQAAPCAPPAAMTVTESPAAVTMLERATPANPQIGCTAGIMPGLLTVRLHAPLGRRVLRDGITGRPLTWFDQRRELSPTYLPPGFSARSRSVPFAFPILDGPPAAICTQLFFSTFWGYWLAITQLASAASDSRLKMDPPGRTLQWQAVEVRGHRGWLASDRLTWYEDGQSILIVTSGGPASPAQLLAIARNHR